MQNIPTKTDDDELTSAEFNEVANELETAATSSGQALSATDLRQVAKGAGAYVAQQNRTADSGAVNAYLLTVPAPFKPAPAYSDGLQIVFKPATGNTGASTLNYNALGARPIKQNGNDLIGGEMTDVTVVRYDEGNDWFEIVSARSALYFEESRVRVQRHTVRFTEYGGKFADTSGQTSFPVDAAFSPDGLTVFVLDAGLLVYQYTLSTPWDVSTAAYASKSFSVGAQDGAPEGLAVKPDGTAMYVVGDSNNTIYQYTLSTPWDVSTAAYASKSFSVGAQDLSPRAAAFSADGTAMFMAGDVSDLVFQYTLSTPWDVSTAAYASKSFSFAGQETTSTGLSFGADGDVFFLVGGSNKTVFSYTLSTPWDVSTAFYAGENVAILDFTTTVGSVTIGDDGLKFFTTDSGGQAVRQYPCNALTT